MDYLSLIPERKEIGLDIQKDLSDIYTRLYTNFLKSFIYDDVEFEDNATELTLGTILNEHSEIICHGDDSLGTVNAEGINGGHIFREDEILANGMSGRRRQLSPTATKRLREEIDVTLRTVAELFYTSHSQEDASSNPPISRLPDDLQGQVGGINSMQLELQALSLRLRSLLGETRTTREEFERDLEQLICNTFPTFKTSRNASIDLLSATFEATLQKLNFVRESARQAFYNHQVEQNPMNTELRNVSQAISIAYQALVEEEDALKTETQDLDRQIQEYESLLRLVDGSGGGYQQIVKDWLKINRETDECLKDLRRLGWTGD